MAPLTTAPLTMAPPTTAPLTTPSSSLLQAAVACVDCMTPEEIASGRTFPELKHIRDVSRKVRCHLYSLQ